MGSRVDIVTPLAGAGAAIQLPWNREPGERLRFGLSLGLFLIILLPLAIVVPRIDLPEPDRQVLEQVPPQLARLIEEKPEPKPEPKAPVEPVKPPEPKPSPEPPKAEPEPTPVETPPPQPVSPKPDVAPPQTTQQARAVAAKSGLLALSQELSAMQNVDADAPKRHLSANVNDDAASAAIPKESADVLAASKGVEDAEGPRESVALASHEVKQVEVPKANTAPARKQKEVARESGPGERSMANIRRGFDQQKAALFSMYNRALRKNPALAGEVLLEVTIEPDGHVSDCRIVSSELDSPALEQKIIARVSLFNFGAADVTQRLVRFPINFLPS